MKNRLLALAVVVLGCGTAAGCGSSDSDSVGFTFVEESILLGVLRSPLNPDMLDAMLVHGGIVMDSSFDYSMSAREISLAWESHWGERLTPTTQEEWNSNVSAFGERKRLNSTSALLAEGIQITGQTIDELVESHPPNVIVVHYSSPVFMNGGTTAFVFVLLSPLSSYTADWGGGQNLFLYRASKVSGTWAITSVEGVSVS